MIGTGVRRELRILDAWQTIPSLLTFGSAGISEILKLKIAEAAVIRKLTDSLLCSRLHRFPLDFVLLNSSLQNKFTAI